MLFTTSILVNIPKFQSQFNAKPETELLIFTNCIEFPLQIQRSDRTKYSKLHTRNSERLLYRKIPSRITHVRLNTAQ